MPAFCFVLFLELIVVVADVSDDSLYCLLIALGIKFFGCPFCQNSLGLNITNWHSVMPNKSTLAFLNVCLVPYWKYMLGSLAFCCFLLSLAVNFQASDCLLSCWQNVMARHRARWKSWIHGSHEFWRLLWILALCMICHDFSVCCTFVSVSVNYNRCNNT